jgi:hypothetical protein
MLDTEGRRYLVLTICYEDAELSVTLPKSLDSALGRRVGISNSGTFWDQQYGRVHTVIRSGKLKPYLSKARSIPLSIHPFANIQRAFYAGVPEAAEEEEDDE